MGASRTLLAVAAFAGLSACVTGTRPMPPPTGAPETLEVAGTEYVVTRSAVSSMPGGELMRVYRPRGASFDYAEGKTAKAVALAFCDGYGRDLSPWAMGMFEPTGAWAFPGGCAE